MLKNILKCLAIFTCITHAFSIHQLLKGYRYELHSLPVAGEVGERLILTPYIESGNIEEARTLASVNGGPFSDDIPSYSGFLTVNEEYNSNLFFWFFPAEQNYDNAPVLLWMNGGPGSSSMFGLFTELGPFSVAEDNATLITNPYSWHKTHSIMFIDNPVGTGFSFTDNDDGYATNQEQIGRELYIAMIQFFKMFPELQALPFFITGESYAGKYVPALGNEIHQQNPTAELKINLQGISVGNGFSDPITMLAYSTFLYQLGLIDTNRYEEGKLLEDKAKTFIEEGDYTNAIVTAYELLALFEQNTKFSNIYNLLYETEPRAGGYYEVFVQSEEVRRALHVGDAELTEGGMVLTKLLNDLMVSVRPLIENLLDNYRVLFYNGHLDIIVTYALSVNMFNVLEYEAAEEYRNAERIPWYVDGQLAGYMKSGGKFTEVMVRNAGHMVPTDQPVWSFDLINRFTSDNLLS